MTYKKPLAEPIAIVGSSCRFAGATSPSKFWDLLSRPSDLSRRVPSNRFNIDGFYHPDGGYHGTTNAPKAYWLDQDPWAFDAAFFGIAPKEAEAVDPQQRLLLEAVYEALEGSGHLMSEWSGKDVAVYVGAMTSDYDTVSQRDDLTTSPYYATGNARSILSNRISYFYDFHGPSATIDTACSSSLVALHQAVLGLRAGDCSAACVAGVNLMLAPEQFVAESTMHMLSPTGHCRMWDASADGYARGEGVAVVLLKSLSRALADGDGPRIQGLIRETGVGSDGKTAGITMPSSDAQAALIRETYRRAGLDPTRSEDRCQYFEAHGTGTPVGDPREAKAIQSAFFPDLHSHDSQELLVGSAKTVIGHTEGAAGLAGVLKAILSMRHGQVSANLHMDKLNPEVSPFYRQLRVPTELIPWPAVPQSQPARASVNSFGFGGTNAHVILEMYQPEIHNKNPVVCTAVTTIPHIPLLLSANSSASLGMLVVKYRDHLRQYSDTDSTDSLRRLAWRAFTSRSAFPFRLAVSATTSSMAEEILSRLANIQGDDRVPPQLALRAYRWNKTGDRSSPKLLGIFTGQGAQWAGMSRYLFAESQIYRESIMALDAHLADCPDPPAWSLVEELQRLSNVSNVHRADFSQPLCTAVQIGLVDLLHNGLRLGFSCVIGHSSGEIGAAYAAGRLTARDAILIAYYRGLAVASPGQNGGMIAVGLSRAEAERFCLSHNYRGKLQLAASNSLDSATLSGDRAAVEEAERELASKGIFARRLLVDVAYHSRHMATYADAYADALKKCSISPISPESGCKTTWISSVDPENDPSMEQLGSPYWITNMVRPVLFHEALTKALLECSGGFDLAVEIGPHPALKGPSQQTETALPGEHMTPYTSVLQRGKRDDIAFSEFIGFMWTHLDPAPFDLKGLLHNQTLSCDSQLPAYPWDHSQTYYNESRISRQFHFRSQPLNELLGSRTRDDVEGYEYRWRNLLRPEKLPWLQHHSFQGQPLLPASAYCLMALEAAKVVLAGRRASVVELEDVQFFSGIVFEADGPPHETMFSLSVQEPHKCSQFSPIRVTGTEAVRASFRVYSAPKGAKGALQQRCTGNIRIVLGVPAADELPTRMQGCEQPETLSVNTDSFYAMLAGLGLQYSGPFKALTSIDRRFNFATATLNRRHEEDTTGLSISPATLDACLQVCFSTYSSAGDKALWTAFLPTSIKKVTFNMAFCGALQQSRLVVDATMASFSAPSHDSQAYIVGDVCIFNESRYMEIQIEGLTVGSLASSEQASRHERHEPYLHTVMDLDPEDILIDQNLNSTALDAPLSRVLEEECFKVAAFYQGKRNSIENEALGKLILASPHFATLNATRLAASRPTLWARPHLIPFIMEQGSHLHSLQKHIKRLTQQLFHRYPRMSVLGLTHPSACLSSYIIDGSGASFDSLVFGQSGTEGNLQYHLSRISQSLAAKIHQVPIHFQGRLGAQISSVRELFDLVILSTTVLRSFQSTSEALLDIKSMMRPGGFLVLIDTDVHSMLSFGHPGHSGICTPPEWTDTLNHCSFSHPESRNTDQRLPGGCSVFVRQCRSPLKKDAFQREPMHVATEGQHLLLLGGPNATMHISAQVRDALQSTFRAPVTVVDGMGGLAALPPSAFASFTCCIVLAEVDGHGAILPFSSEERICLFREILQKPHMTMLWVTEGARWSNPNSAAAMGFTRTIRAEMPSLALQMLDFDGKATPSRVVRTFMQLMAAVQHSRHKSPNTPFLAADDHLWTIEPEVYIDKCNRRLIPRVLPYGPANDRATASRQQVTKEVHSMEVCVQIAPAATKTSPVHYETILEEIPERTDDQSILIKTRYSSIHAPLHGKFICIGRDELSGAMVVAFAAKNASFVRIPRADAVVLNTKPKTPLDVFLATVTRLLVHTVVHRRAKNRSVVLLGPDDLYAQCAAKIGSPTVIHSGLDRKGCVGVLVHPRATKQQMSAALYASHPAIFIDFLSSEHPMSHFVSATLPQGSECLRMDDLMNASADNGIDILRSAVHLSLNGKFVYCQTSEETVTIPNLLSSKTEAPKFQVADWCAERKISHTIRPSNVDSRIMAETHLRPDKTYLLCGMTRDMGQSLSTLLVKQGARNIVLASRSPKNQHPRWAQDMARRHGATIRVETVDVTRMSSIDSLRQRLRLDMPPVGGIVNGAMVLEDSVFARMTAEMFERVMLPKTLGSQNLGAAFGDCRDLDFFIMTSSFAAIGGHAGQSNYAAANMYMNAFAARRKQQGLAGSVLNIGVVHGLGFLHRERGELYLGLDREGYPPVSERDLHNMFLEAVALGRPACPEFIDLTTGLSRFVADPTGMTTLHWHRDPRFSHLTTADATTKTDTVCIGSEGPMLLLGGGSTEAVAKRLLAMFCGRLMALLQAPPDGRIHGASSLSEVGVDSLVAVEMRSWLWQVAEQDVPVMKMLGAASIEKLCFDVARSFVAVGSESSE